MINKDLEGWNKEFFSTAARLDELTAEILFKEANHEPTASAYAEIREVIKTGKRQLDQMWHSTPEN